MYVNTVGSRLSEQCRRLEESIPALESTITDIEFETGLEDLAIVRLPLESTIASLAALNRTDAHLARLSATQRVLANPRKSLAAHVKADLQFHSILAEATGNRMFPLVLAPIQDRLTDSRLRTLRHFGAHIAHEHHDKILEAVREKDAEGAAAAMREHLTVNCRHLEEMVRQERVSIRPR